jgi:TPR repeat protein
VSHSQIGKFNAAAARPRRRLHPLLQTVCGIVIAGYAGLVLAIGTESLANPPASKALALLSEPDLMETAFREGLVQYEEGDYTEATRTWMAPARHGHAGAQFSLGVAYATGNGVTQSLDTAIAWWIEAADRGHTTAQLNLGLLYWRGAGVEKNLAKAHEWWRRAAERGDAAAQFHLGAMAATGEGIPLDFNTAIRWWRLSAAQGYELAIEGLDIMERHGFASAPARLSAEQQTRSENHQQPRE